jgi:hypothetical protein
MAFLFDFELVPGATPKIRLRVDRPKPASVSMRIQAMSSRQSKRDSLCISTLPAELAWQGSFPAALEMLPLYI